MRTKLYGVGILILGILFAGTAMAAVNTSLEKLGEAVFINKNLSINRNQSCQSCHHPKAAFADPDSQIPVSEGSNPLFGNRNAPSAAYAGFSPQFHWNGALFIGGVFWDGRASGLAVTDTGTTNPDGSLKLSGTEPTYDPMADQAKGPFQNRVEMALADITPVVNFVLNDKQLYNLYLQNFPPPFHTDGTVNYPEAYNNIAKGIAAFERSTTVNKFSSRFDQFVIEYGGNVSMFGVTEDCSIAEFADGSCFRRYVGPPAGFTSNNLTQKQLVGLALFNSDSATQLEVPLDPPATPITNGGMCYLCHVTTNYDANDYATTTGNLSLVAPGVYPPLFTDFSYDNLGIPVNPVARSLSGVTEADIGLGAQIPIMEAADPDYSNVDNPNDGKFKVPSLRGVLKSAPYGHNGYFTTLTDIVNFYNNRAAFYTSTGTVAEVSTNMNTTELGNLGMNTASVDALVAFMKALTDQ